jgi:membrane protein implicated in regulation of membrane protease activity
MTWSDVYLFCFLVGASLSVFSFLAGAIHLHMPFNIHLPFHAPHVGHAHVGGHGGNHGTSASHVSWFNASTVLAFLAWFGGVGYLMTKYSHVESFFVVAISTGAGLAAGWFVLRFLVKLVGEDDEPLRESDGRVIGAVGTVSMTIRENGTGEIIFPLAGSRRCAGARSEDGALIEKGAEIVIARYEKGIAYVRRWEEFVNS